jgi:nucleotide-binding universal stress UspA family protein
LFSKVLVPLEAADQSVNLDFARTLAENLGSQLVLLRVVTVMASEEPFLQQIQVEIGSSAARKKAEAAEQTLVLERRLRARGLNVHGTVVVSGRSEADAIVDYATSEGCDLIVMPTYRQSVLNRWFLGSLGEKVRQRSGVPVLFVKAP